MLEVNKSYSFGILSKSREENLTKITRKGLENGDEYEIPIYIDKKNEEINLLVTGYDEKRKRYFFSQKICDNQLIKINKSYKFRIIKIYKLSNRAVIDCDYEYRKKSYKYQITYSLNILAIKNYLEGKVLTFRVNSIFDNQLRITINEDFFFEEYVFQPDYFVINEEITEYSIFYSISFRIEENFFKTKAKDWQFFVKEKIKNIKVKYDIKNDRWYQIFEKNEHPNYIFGEKYKLLICYDTRQNKFFLETETGEKIYYGHYVTYLEDLTKKTEGNKYSGNSIELVFKGINRHGILLFDYFIDFQDIIKDSKADYFVFKRILEKDIYDVDTKEVRKLYDKFKGYYEIFDNRWIVGYIIYLVKVAEFYLNSEDKDYRTASYLLETAKEIAGWVDNPKFKINFKNLEKIKIFASRVINKINHTLKSIELIIDGKEVEYINTYVNEIKESKKNDEFDNGKLEFITYLIRQLDYKGRDKYLLDLTKVLGEKGVFKKKEGFFADFFETLLFERIRFFEKLLFKEVFSNEESRKLFFESRRNELIIGKHYTRLLVNLLKDNNRESKSIYRVYIRGLRYVHLLKETNLERRKSIISSLKSLNISEFNKLTNRFSWDKDFENYLPENLEQDISEFNYQDKNVLMEVKSVNKDLSMYLLSDGINNHDIILPFYLSGRRLSIKEKLNVSITAVDEIDKKVLVKNNKEIKQDKVLLSDELIVNSIYQGIIKNITNFGVFVTVQGIEGLVHLSEIGNAIVNKEKIKSLFKINEELKLKLISIDSDGKHFFSIRQAYKKKVYKRNDIVQGRVFSFGFKHVNIELSDGSIARLYLDKISNSYIHFFEYFFSIGEKVKCKIIGTSNNKLLVSTNFYYQYDSNKTYTAKYLHSDFDFNYYRVLELNVIAKETFQGFQVDSEDEPKSKDLLYKVNLYKSEREDFQIKSKKYLKVTSLKELTTGVYIEKGYLYESISYMQTTFEEKINYLEFSRYYFSQANNARAYYLKVYIYYVELIRKVNSTSYNDESLLELTNYSNEIVLNLDNNETSIETFPIINQFKEVLIIIGLINRSYTETSKVFQEYAFYTTYKRSNELSRLVLSFNLISEETRLRNEIWILIKSSLSSILEKLSFDIKGYDENYELRRVIEKALVSNENKRLEFKATIFQPVLSKSDKTKLEKLKINEADNREQIQKIYNMLVSGERDKFTKVSFVKAIAALSNTEGGDLIIGIDEDVDSNPLANGVEKDLARFKGDVDNYLRNIDVLISKEFGKEFGNNCELHLVDYKSKKYLISRVKKSNRPIYLKLDGKSTFLIRENNQTEKLEGEELVIYVGDRF